MNDTPELINLGISESLIKLFQDFPKVSESDQTFWGGSGGGRLVSRSVGRSMDWAVGRSDPPRMVFIIFHLRFNQEKSAGAKFDHFSIEIQLENEPQGKIC